MGLNPDGSYTSPNGVTYTAAQMAQMRSGNTISFTVSNQNPVARNVSVVKPPSQIPSSSQRLDTWGKSADDPSSPSYQGRGDYVYVPQTGGVRKASVFEKLGGTLPNAGQAAVWNLSISTPPPGIAKVKETEINSLNARVNSLINQANTRGYKKDSQGSIIYPDTNEGRMWAANLDEAQSKVKSAFESGVASGVMTKKGDEYFLNHPETIQSLSWRETSTKPWGLNPDNSFRSPSTDIIYPAAAVAAMRSGKQVTISGDTVVSNGKKTRNMSLSWQGDAVKPEDNRPLFGLIPSELNPFKDLDAKAYPILTRGISDEEFARRSEEVRMGVEQAGPLGALNPIMRRLTGFEYNLGGQYNPVSKPISVFAQAAAEDTIRHPVSSAAEFAISFGIGKAIPIASSAVRIAAASSFASNVATKAPIIAKASGIASKVWPYASKAATYGMGALFVGTSAYDIAIQPTPTAMIQEAGRITARIAPMTLGFMASGVDLGIASKTKDWWIERGGIRGWKDIPNTVTSYSPKGQTPNAITNSAIKAIKARNVNLLGSGESIVGTNVYKINGKTITPEIIPKTDLIHINPFGETVKAGGGRYGIKGSQYTDLYEFIPEEPKVRLYSERPIEQVTLYKRPRLDVEWAATEYRGVSIREPVSSNPMKGIRTQSGGLIRSFDMVVADAAKARKTTPILNLHAGKLEYRGIAPIEGEYAELVHIYQKLPKTEIPKSGKFSTMKDISLREGTGTKSYVNAKGGKVTIYTGSSSSVPKEDVLSYRAVTDWLVGKPKKPIPAVKVDALKVTGTGVPRQIKPLTSEEALNLARIQKESPRKFKPSEGTLNFKEDKVSEADMLSNLKKSSAEWARQEAQIREQSAVSVQKVKEAEFMPLDLDRLVGQTPTTLELQQRMGRQDMGFGRRRTKLIYDEVNEGGPLAMNYKFENEPKGLVGSRTRTPAEIILGSSVKQPTTTRSQAVSPFPKVTVGSTVRYRNSDITSRTNSIISNRIIGANLKTSVDTSRITIPSTRVDTVSATDITNIQSTTSIQDIASIQDVTSIQGITTVQRIELLNLLAMPVPTKGLTVKQPSFLAFPGSIGGIFGGRGSRGKRFRETIHTSTAFEVAFGKPIKLKKAPKAQKTMRLPNVFSFAPVKAHSHARAHAGRRRK